MMHVHTHKSCKTTLPHYIYIEGTGVRNSLGENWDLNGPLPNWSNTSNLQLKFWLVASNQHVNFNFLPSLFTYLFVLCMAFLFFFIPRIFLEKYYSMICNVWIYAIQSHITAHNTAHIRKTGCKCLLLKGLGFVTCLLRFAYLCTLKFMWQQDRLYRTPFNVFTVVIEGLFF